MVRYILVLLFIGLAFWGCEEDEKIPEVKPEGIWNLVSSCEYDYGDCTVNCTEVNLEAYCDTSDGYSGTSNLPDNEEDCNNLSGYWVKELTVILTINDNMTGTLDISDRYGDEGVYKENVIHTFTLVENSTSGYFVIIENVPEDPEVNIIITLSDNGESLYLKNTAYLLDEYCLLWTFSR